MYTPFHELQETSNKRGIGTWRLVSYACQEVATSVLQYGKKKEDENSLISTDKLTDSANDEEEEEENEGEDEGEEQSSKRTKIDKQVFPSPLVIPSQQQQTNETTPHIVTPTTPQTPIEDPMVIKAIRLFESMPEALQSVFGISSVLTSNVFALATFKPHMVQTACTKAKERTVKNIAWDEVPIDKFSFFIDVDDMNLWALAVKMKATYIFKPRCASTMPNEVTKKTPFFLLS